VFFAATSRQGAGLSVCMKKLMLGLLAVSAFAATNVAVNIQLGVGHPIQRFHPVVVHRAPIVVGTVVYARPVVWTRVVVGAPRSARMVWEDRETFDREENWVDTGFRVRNMGRELLFRVQGRAEIDFAEVHYGNGQVQVVDFNGAALANGVFRLHDVAGRHVENVRMIARSLSPRSTITLWMAR